MRINLLLIFFVLMVFPQMTISANSVSGQYSLPVRSVRFQKQSNFSILPIGWSKTGNAAFLISDTQISTVKLLIMDAVEDRPIWISSDKKLEPEHNLTAFWNDNIDLFSSKLSASGIIPDGEPVYGGTVFSSDRDEYKLVAEELSQTGVNGIASLRLKILSKNRGEKTLYKYVHSGSEKSLLVDFQVLGYFRSPWENRIISVSAEDFLDPQGDDVIDLRFSGAHLSLGFRRIVNEDTQLIDAVLGGQYYNSRTLLQNGVKADCTVNTGEPLVLLAAKQYNWDLVFLLLDYGAGQQGRDRRGRTLLHYALIEGNEAVAGKLLLLGLKQDIEDNDGETPLSLAEKLNGAQ